MSTSFDRHCIVEFLRYLGHSEAGGVTEVRGFPKSRYIIIQNRRVYVGNIVSGYYDDYEKLARDIEPFDGKANIYVTINPCIPDLLARAANRLQIGAKVTTSDDEILCDLWFPIDVDPVRPAGISSTQAELDLALAKLDEVADFLSPWASVVKGMSGNGGHRLIRLPGYPNSEETRKAKERLTRFLSERFSDQRSVWITRYSICLVYGNYMAQCAVKVTVSPADHKGDPTLRLSLLSLLTFMPT